MDSGSVSPTGLHNWCVDFGEGRVGLRDIQGNSIKSCGSQQVSLETWGLDGSVKCLVMSNMAEVAHLIMSLGRLNAIGFASTFHKNLCLMAKGSRSAEI